jgi:hypothetical protein
VRSSSASRPCPAYLSATNRSRFCNGPRAGSAMARDSAAGDGP